MEYVKEYLRSCIDSNNKLIKIANDESQPELLRNIAKRTLNKETIEPYYINCRYCEDKIYPYAQGFNFGMCYECADEKTMS
jgi:hypothetical protein